jgi:hypothetical protein
MDMKMLPTLNRRKRKPLLKKRRETMKMTKNYMSLAK